jgi:stage V sporulation protein B
MIALTPIIPIVAMTAVLRGYFRGKQNMNPLAISDVIENLMQIAVVLVVIHWLLPYGVEIAAAGAMVSAVVGEASGLLYLFATYQLTRKKKEAAEPALPDNPEENGRTLRDLLRLGLPLTGSGLIHSVFRAFLPLLVINSLLMSGVSAAGEATSQFGLLSGFVFPLLLLPSFFTNSLSSALIPAISEASVDRNSRLIHYRMDLAMRIALYVGIPCTIILYIWAEQLTTVIYKAPEAGALLKMMVPFYFFNYFQAPLQAILLGLGKSSTVMWNLIICNLFEAAAIFTLGSQFGIKGVALGIGISEIVLTLLLFHSISSKIGFYTDLRILIKAVSGSLAMTICGLAAYSFLERSGAGLAVNVLGAVAVSLLVYIMTLRAIHPFQPEPKTPVWK